MTNQFLNPVDGRNREKKIDTLSYIHDHPHYLLGTDTSIQICGVKLNVLLSLSGESSAYGCTSGWKAAGALEVIAFLALLAAVILVILKMFFMKDKPPLRIAAIVCCFIGGKFSNW